MICQAELLAVPVAMATWKQAITGRDVIFFVDNEPAKDALIHGSSSSLASSQMVRWSRLFCAAQAVGAWYERVPSPSNIADAPSRADFSALKLAGACEVAAVPPSLEQPVRFLPFT